MKFPQPYTHLAGILSAWKRLTDILQKDEEKKTEDEKPKQTVYYQHYQETLNKIFLELKQLPNQENTAFRVVTLLNSLHKDINSFTEIKGKKGCPVVMTKGNHYETTFALHFVHFVPKVMAELEKAYEKDTSIPWGLQSITDGFLKKAISASQKNVETVKASLSA